MQLVERACSSRSICAARSICGGGFARIRGRLQFDIKTDRGCTCGCQIGAWLPDLSHSFFLFFFFLCLRRQGERVEEGAIFQGVGRKWLLLTRFPPRPLHLSRVSLHLPRTHFHMYAGPFVARAMETHTRTDGSAHTHARTQSLCMNSLLAT